MKDFAVRAGKEFYFSPSLFFCLTGLGEMMIGFIQRTVCFIR